MTALKAHVVNGRIVLDEPVELPDGAELAVYLSTASDGMTADDSAALDRGLAQADAGQLVDADDVLAELRRS